MDGLETLSLELVGKVLTTYRNPFKKRDLCNQIAPNKGKHAKQIKLCSFFNWNIIAMSRVGGGLFKHTEGYKNCVNMSPVTLTSDVTVTGLTWDSSRRFISGCGFY